MIPPSAPRPSSLRVLCAPYHLYTHRKELEVLFEHMHARSWQVSICLPFTAAETLETMTQEAQGLPHVTRVHDLACRRLITLPGQVASRIGRAVALLVYGLRAWWLLRRERPDVLLLTSDLGGVSVRFLQLLCQRFDTPVLTLQTTLFLKVTEREDLRFEFRPKWLHALLSRGVLKQLFLFFGDVPGTFLPQKTYLGVQDEEIRQVCHEFGKPMDRMRVLGSLQGARMVESRRKSLLHHPVDGAWRPLVLFLTECIEERFGLDTARQHLSWMRELQRTLEGECDFTVRFHPRESSSYKELAKDELGAKFRLDTSTDPIDAASRADVVVGAFSMLLFDAQTAGVPAVFLDVGCDPIGFYGSRRAPLARNAQEVSCHVKAALQDGARVAVDGLDSQGWVRSVADWIRTLSGKP